MLVDLSVCLEKMNKTHIPLFRVYYISQMGKSLEDTERSCSYIGLGGDSRIELQIKLVLINSGRAS